MYSRKAVLYDVANLAYVVGDVREDAYSSHSLHQLFDICEPGNIDWVNRVLDTALADVALIVGDCKYTVARRRYIRSLVHEYLVARVFSDWLQVALPCGHLLERGSSSRQKGSSATRSGDDVLSIWKEKATEARMALVAAAKVRGMFAFTRKMPVV